jgi:gliding motility-associated-like protein
MMNLIKKFALFAILLLSTTSYAQCDFLCNGDFEQPGIPVGSQSNKLDSLGSNPPQISCWKTTEADHQIEVWGSYFPDGYPGDNNHKFKAYSGNNFVELNANAVSTLYQNFRIGSGTTLTVNFAHRGRAGKDTMIVQVGPVGGPYVKLTNSKAGTFGNGTTNFIDDTTKWNYYTTTYTFPSTGFYSLRFTAAGTASHNNTVGNFIDDVSIQTTPVWLGAKVLTNVTCNGGNDGSAMDSTFRAPSKYTFLWSNGATTQYVYGLTAGNYSVTVKDTVGCTNTRTLTITQPSSLPTATISGTASVCQNAASPNITFTASGGIAPYTFTYKINGGTATTTSTGTNIAVAAPTNVAGTFTYSLISFTDANSCTQVPIPASGSATITVNQLPVMSNLPTATICSGTAVNLAFTSTVSSAYVWIATSVPPGTSGASTSPQVSNTLSDVIVNTTTNTVQVIYTVTPVSKPQNCAGATQTLTITVKPLPTLTLTAATVCSGVKVNFNLVANLNSTFTWIATDNSNTSGETTSPLQSTNKITDIITNNASTAQVVTYSVTATTTNGSCSGAVTPVNITVNPSPQGSFSGNSRCVTGPSLGLLTWVATAGTGPYNIKYNKQGGGSVTKNSIISGTSFSVSPAGTPTVTTTYTLVSVKDSTTGCTTTTGFTGPTAVITVTNTPISITGGTPSAQSTCSGTSTSFVIQATNVGTYAWQKSIDNGTTWASIVAPGAAPKYSGYTTDSLVVANADTSHNGYQFRVILKDACGAFDTSATAVLTVNPIPQFPIGTSTTLTICSGTVATYTPTSSVSGSSFAWSRAAVAGIAQAAASGTGNINDTLTNTTASPINVTYSYTITANSCNSSTKNVVVTVNPLPIIQSTASATVCSGVGIFKTLTANLVGTTFKWIATDNPNTTGESTDTVYTNIITDTIINPSGVTQPISYTVLATSPLGCNGTPPQVVVINIDPLPTASIAKDTVVYEGQQGVNIVFTGASGTPPYTFTYNINGGANKTVSSTGASNTVSVNLPNDSLGTYTYSLVGVWDASTNVCTQLQTGSAVVVVNPLQLSITNATNGAEGFPTPTNVTFTVRLNHKNTTGSPVTGTLTLTGAATPTKDYSEAGVTGFSIPNGLDSVLITLHVKNDSLVEPTESVIATISNPSYGAVIVTPTDTAYITDYDSQHLSTSITPAFNGAEGYPTTPVIYYVKLDSGRYNATGSPITGVITYTGTATDGKDYSSIGTYSIPDGSDLAIINIPVLNDSLIEPTESVIATISNPSLGVVNPIHDTATAYILDYNSTVFTTSIINPTNGAKGNPTTPVKFTVKLDKGFSNQSGAPLTGTITYTASTAVGGVDYTAVTTYTIANNSDSVVIADSVLNSLFINPTLKLQATITPSKGGTVKDTATAYIIDYNSTVLTTSIINPINGAKGNPTTPVKYTIQLDGGLINQTGVPITGTITYTASTAVAGVDYTAVTTYTIANGSGSVVITDPVLNSLFINPTLTLHATISNPSLGTVNTIYDTATAYIIDYNSTVLTTSIVSPINGAKGNPTTPVNYTIQLDGGLINQTGAPITGTITYTASTAVAGVDYTAVTTYTIANGSGSVVITDPVLNSLFINPTLTLHATISNPSLGIVNSTYDTATAYIIDYNSTILTTSIVSPINGAKGNPTTPVKYTIQLDGGLINQTGAPITGTITYTASTAVAGVDYTAVTTYTIANGSGSVQIADSVLNSLFINPTLKLKATISNPSLGIVNSTYDTATAYIIDYNSTILTTSIVSPINGAKGNPTTPVKYTIQLDGGLINQIGVPITGTITYTASTAVAGVDYTAVTTYTIANGSGSAVITDPVLNTLLINPTLTLHATISNPSLGIVNSIYDTATAYIIDYNSTVLSTSIVSPINGAKGNPTTPVKYTIQLDGGLINQSGAPITGTITYTASTAVAGVDYTAVTTYTIANGSGSVVITDPVLNSSFINPTLKLQATISNPSLGIINTTYDTATAYIIDYNSTVFTTSIINPTNGAKGNPTTPVTYTIKLDGGLINQSGAPITGTITYTASTAVAGVDYTAVTTYTIANGSGSVVITDPVLNSLFIDPTLKLKATITPSKGGTTRDTATAYIIDYNSTVFTTSIINPINGAKGNPTTPVKYTVKLDGGLINQTGAPITGTITYTASTAVAGVDYTTITTYTIANGVGSGTVTVPVLNNQFVSPTLKLQATITPSKGGTTIDTATAYIIDYNHTILTISIGKPTNGAESSPPINITYTVSMDEGKINATGAPITGILTLSGTATAGSDYTNVVTFSIPNGESTGLVIVPVLNDNIEESPESVIATISSPNYGTVSTQDTATAYIFELHIPNIFTPNGDNVNDVYMLKYPFMASIDAQIYNRWGTMLHEWTTPDGGWNGTSPSGGNCPDGTYYYVIKITDTQGNKILKTGYIELMR